MVKKTQASLADSLLSPEHKDAVITDLAKTLETHVNQMKGLKGIGLRTTLSMLKSGRADAVPGAMSRLMPGFISALDPMYQQHLSAQAKVGKPTPFSVYLLAHRQEAANLMIGVADRRVEASSNSMLQSGYGRFRDTIASELVNALPALAAVIDKHLAS